MAKNNSFFHSFSNKTISLSFIRKRFHFPLSHIKSFLTFAENCCLSFRFEPELSLFEPFREPFSFMAKNNSFFHSFSNKTISLSFIRKRFHFPLSHIKSFLTFAENCCLSFRFEPELSLFEPNFSFFSSFPSGLKVLFFTSFN